MLISDHLLAIFFTVSPMWQSDLVWKLFQEKNKICGIAQHIPNFCHSQASCILPYPVQVKGRLGEKVSLSFQPSVHCWTLPPAQGGFAIFHSGVPFNPQGMGSQDQEKSWRIQERKENYVGSSLVCAERQTDSEGWGAGRKAIKLPGSKVHYGAGGGLEVTFQDSAS